MDAQLATMEKLFQALGDSTRLRVLGLLLTGIGSGRGVRSPEVEKLRRIDRDRLAA